MRGDDVLVAAHDTVFDGYLRVDRYRLRHRLHAGGTGAEIAREVLERGHVAAVLPYDAARDRVVLLEQFRIGACAAGWDPWLREAVAGIIEDGEEAEAVARREGLEEAGCRITDLAPIARYLTTPGACTETVRLYCGRIDSEGVGGIHGLAEEGEDIRVHVLDARAAFALLDAGEIRDSKTIIALQWLALHHETMRRRWG